LISFSICSTGQVRSGRLTSSLPFVLLSETTDYLFSPFRRENCCTRQIW